MKQCLVVCLYVQLLAFASMRLLTYLLNSDHLWDRWVLDWNGIVNDWQCSVSYFLKVTCYSYCYILKVRGYFTSYFIDTLLHHLNPNLIIALTLNPSTNPNSNPLNGWTDLVTHRWATGQTFNDTVLKSTFPSLHILLTASKITLSCLILYNFNAAAHLRKCKLK